MALILLNWCYSFFILLGMGVWAVKLFKINTENLFYILIAGMFLEMLLLHFVLIFIPADFILYLVNFLICSVIVYFNRNHILTLLKSVLNQWKNWNQLVKILAGLVSISILIKSSSVPFLVDNETYYVQTLKWLNEYGLVKGLGNLHIFFGQMSGWHLLQSGLNFGFISDHLNDINGFLIFIFSLFALNRFNEYISQKKNTDLYLGLVVCFNFIFFQFVTSPSPDLPVFLLSQVLFYLFIVNFKNYKGDFNLMLLLAIMLCTVKITSFLILFLPLLLLIKHKLFLEKKNFTIGICIVSLSAFIIKNFLITGLPLYPLNISIGNFPDWKVTESYQTLFSNPGWKNIRNEQLAQFNFIEKLNAWLFKSKGVDMVFNIFYILLLLIFPFFIKKNKSIFFIWILAIAHLALLIATSPQYRFFMHLIIAMTLIIFSFLFTKKALLNKFIFTTSVSILFLSLFINLNIHFSNFQPKNIAAFDMKNMVLPHPNSAYQIEFEKIKDGNLIYHSPILEKQEFWGSYDGNLPCVNEAMIKHLKKRHKFRPQMRTSKLKDGFYSQNLKK